MMLLSLCILAELTEPFLKLHPGLLLVSSKLSFCAIIEELTVMFAVLK